MPKTIGGLVENYLETTSDSPLFAGPDWVIIESRVVAFMARRGLQSVAYGDAFVLSQYYGSLEIQTLAPGYVRFLTCPQASEVVMVEEGD
jgi:hypothetical protein